MSFSVVLFDRSEDRNHLLPLVATRPVGNLRVGAFTLDQKWAKIFGSNVSFLTVDYLATKFPLEITEKTVLLINAHVLPTQDLVEAIEGLQAGERLISDNGWIALKVTYSTVEDLIIAVESPGILNTLFEKPYQQLHHLEDIFTYNASQIEFDCQFFSKENKRELESSVIINGDKVYISPLAKLFNCILNAESGPIIIEDNAIIEPFCMIHGPAVIGNNVRVKSGTILYSNVTIGPNCTINGELNNTVIWGNTSKGHYGYLGCAVIGEGCNLGAGTTNSNLKNDWNDVKIYSYSHNNYRNTELMKCGVIIGDHSMLAIASKINTGTVIGVGAQVAISNFIPKFVPDFSWISDSTCESYLFPKFVEMMHRKSDVRKEVFSEKDEQILAFLYEKTKYLRIN